MVPLSLSRKPSASSARSTPNPSPPAELPQGFADVAAREDRGPAHPRGVAIRRGRRRRDEGRYVSSAMRLDVVPIERPLGAVLAEFPRWGDFAMERPSAAISLGFGQAWGVHGTGDATGLPMRVRSAPGPGFGSEAAIESPMAARRPLAEPRGHEAKRVKMALSDDDTRRIGLRQASFPMPSVGQADSLAPYDPRRRTRLASSFCARGRRSGPYSTSRAASRRRMLKRDASKGEKLESTGVVVRKLAATVAIAVRPL